MATFKTPVHELAHGHDELYEKVMALHQAVEATMHIHGKPQAALDELVAKAREWKGKAAAILEGADEKPTKQQPKA